MVKVKVKRAHSNPYGAKYEKAKGEEYDLPAAAAVGLEESGLVELVKVSGASGNSKPS